MGRYTEIEDTFYEIWRELESVKERLYLIDENNINNVSLNMIDRIYNTVAESQNKVLDLQHKYQIHFAVELEKEMDSE